MIPAPGNTLKHTFLNVSMTETLCEQTSFHKMANGYTAYHKGCNTTYKAKILQRGKTCESKMSDVKNTTINCLCLVRKSLGFSNWVAQKIQTIGFNLSCIYLVD